MANENNGCLICKNFVLNQDGTISCSENVINFQEQFAAGDTIDCNKYVEKTS